MALRRSLLVLCTLGSAGLAPLVVAATPGDLFYERSLMSAAGSRCGLFEPDIAAALAAARRQARGAALRAGAEAEALDALAARAEARAAVVPCKSADLATAAGRVRGAFAGYSRLSGMTFPGTLGSWRAERRGLGVGWRLSQSAKGVSGTATLGLAAAEGGPDILVAVAAWPAAGAASGARLVVRDPAKAPHPYLDHRRSDLAGRTAPRSVARAYLASNRQPAPEELLPANINSGTAFTFPAAAAAALEALDPREAVVLEVIYSTRRGERTEQLAFEVGDFAAGRAFLSARR